ncbi:MAG TPA: class I SAM-dependent methyltransferase [Casimicrobiaceae bacterium]
MTFENPKGTWDERFSRPGYLFGTRPNIFVSRESWRIPRGSRVLCVADGEGRNSAFLAGLGHQVDAFDLSPVAVAKAKRLASRLGVKVNHSVGDLLDAPWQGQFDAVVAVFIQFLAPDQREIAFASMKSAVAPGGLFMVQGYRPEQVRYGTGGPPRSDHMYTRPWLEATFAGWKTEFFAVYDMMLSEGTAHEGLSALIDLVARAPSP